MSFLKTSHVVSCQSKTWETWFMFPYFVIYLKLNFLLACLLNNFCLVKNWWQDWKKPYIHHFSYSNLNLDLHWFSNSNRWKETEFYTTMYQNLLRPMIVQGVIIGQKGIYRLITLAKMFTQQIKKDENRNAWFQGSTTKERLKATYTRAHTPNI